MKISHLDQLLGRLMAIMHNEDAAQSLQELLSVHENLHTDESKLK